MSFHHTVLAGAGVAVIAALVVPKIVGNGGGSSYNVTSTGPAGSSNGGQQNRSLFGSNADQPKQAPRKKRSCDTNGDLGGDSCGGSSTASKSSAPKPGAIKKSAGGRSITIEADKFGQFQLNARMNGRRVPVLVDTGASSVAINMRTARRLGISLKSEDFKHEAQTANGTTKYATAKIREIRIGGIVVDNVTAAVLSDKSLSKTLLGASFLKRLSKYSVEGGELKLTQ